MGTRGPGGPGGNTRALRRAYRDDLRGVREMITEAITMITMRVQDEEVAIGMAYPLYTRSHGLPGRSRIEGINIPGGEFIRYISLQMPSEDGALL